jgi:C4-dicarboxylate transporter DctQ subunit
MIRWCDNQFSKVERFILAGVILFTSLLLFANVFMRYIFHNAIYWAEELVRYSMVWLIFIGGSQVAKHEGHITVDVVHRVVPPKIRIVLEYFVNIVAIVFCLVLAYFSYRQMMRVYISGQISPAMELPMWLPYLSIPVGSALMAIRYLGEFRRRIRHDRSKASRKG